MTDTDPTLAQLFEGPPSPAWTEEVLRRNREFRLRRWHQIRDAHRADTARQQQLDIELEQRRTSAAQALSILDQLVATHDIETFKGDLQAWAASAPPGHGAFNRPNGQMFVNQLVDAAARGPAELGPLLADALTAPADDADARRKLEAMVPWVEAVKQGAHPAPARIPFLCSFMWSLRAPDQWPCLWTSAETSLRDLGWLAHFENQADRYLAFREQVLALDGTGGEVADTLWWFNQDPARVGLDPSLVARCQLLRTFQGTVLDGAWEQAETHEALSAATVVELEGIDLFDAARDIISDLHGELAVYGRCLSDAVADALGRSVRLKQSALSGRRLDGLPTSAWVEWQVAEHGVKPAGVMLWVTGDGVHIVSGGTHDLPANEAPGLAEELLPLMAQGLQAFATAGSEPEALSVVDLHQGQGSLGIQSTEQTSLASDHAIFNRGFAIGARYSDQEALGDPAFSTTITRIAADLQPVVDRLISTLGGPASTRQTPEDDPLRPLVDEFLDGYPTEKDQSQREERAIMADLLTEDEILHIDIDEFRRIYGSNRYGSAGNQNILHTTMRNAGPQEREDILRKVKDLLWGSGEFADRIDRLLSPEHRVHGLGESVIWKLLAICHPERFIPGFPLTGGFAKPQLMRQLGLDPLDTSASRGRRQVVANDAIRAQLDRYFPNDPWGMSQFLYWLRWRDEAEEAASVDLAETAGQLHLDVEHLQEWVELLHDKGQVVFYGPPGTGKTYVARQLAAALAPEPSRRAVVQFHPSSTYEDFFEGYRPDGVDGQVTYRLTPGPLAILAERASRSPGLEHVLVIDELNRANIPKVFGELLYLLEYRDEPVRTLYRPDDPFELPANLRIIATMNTADRSVGLVDAALRRRFHFVPFFPNEGPTAGVLRRWLRDKGESPWPADFVDLVNDELRDALGGPDLQIGHSHFMKEGLDNEQTMRRIWNYSVHPTITDQLYGNQDLIDQFRFDEVMARYRAQLGGADLPQAGDDPDTGALSAEV